MAMHSQLRYTMASLVTLILITVDSAFAVSIWDCRFTLSSFYVLRRTVILAHAPKTS